MMYIFSNRISLVLVFMLLFGCNDDMPGDSYYSGGDLNVNPQDSVVVNFPVEGNMNINGVAVLSDSSTVMNNLNINAGGKVYVLLSSNSEVVIGGDMNVNDSLIVEQGALVVNKNMNNNATGIVVNKSLIHVYGNLNQNGVIFGFDGMQIEGTTNLNSGNETYP